ncbi:MAG: O-antigen ligase family protein [Pirellulaceae bacterium]|nr:O-antigen ligase family protein [Planctomycetales bacterium]
MLWYCAYGALVSPHMRDADLDLLRSFLTNALLLVCTCRITYFVTAGRKLWRERLLWLTYVMGFLATVSVFLGFFVAGWQESVSTSGYRQAGVFVNPNTASFQVLFFIATGFALAASRARVHWVTATLLIAAPAILATSSRTGIIGFLSIPLGLAVIAFPGRNTNRAIITILVSALIVGGGLAYGYRKAANVDQAKRIRETIALVSLAVNGKLDRENTSARTIIFSRAIEMIRYAPITGNGFGRMSRMPGLGVGPHNMFLLFLGEVGVLGTIPIVIAAYCYLKLGHHTDVRWQKVMVLGYFACEFLSSMTSHNVFTDRPATCMLGVSLGILHSSETDIRSVLERRRRAGRTVPTEQSE